MAAARGRRGPGGPHPYPLVPNNNHERPLKLKSKKDKVKEEAKIQLTGNFRVENESINLENEKLIEVYNDLLSIGKEYNAAITSATDGKKAWLANELGRLSVNFAGVVKKIKTQEDAVRRIGGEPVPLPGPFIRKLPNALQRILKAR